jgi:hypothetical protein
MVAAVAGPGATAARRQSDIQDKPDFSGRWILQSASESGPDVPKALSVRLSVTRTTARGEPMRPWYSAITIGRQLPGGTHSESRDIGIEGGHVGGVRADGRPSGSFTRYKVVWEARVLIFEEETGDAGSWTGRREVWSMDPDGRLHVVLTTRGADRPARSLTLAYRRE